MFIPRPQAWQCLPLSHLACHAWLPFCLPPCLFAYTRVCLLPACLRACVPACLPAYVPACLPTCLPACLRACLLACLRSCLPACVPAYPHARLQDLKLQRAYKSSASGTVFSHCPQYLVSSASLSHAFLLLLLLLLLRLLLFLNPCPFFHLMRFLLKETTARLSSAASFRPLDWPSLLTDDCCQRDCYNERRVFHDSVCLQYGPALMCPQM